MGDPNFSWLGGIIAENTDGSAVDKVKLVGLNATDVSFGRTGDNLTITITASGEQLTVQNHFSSTTNGIEQRIFADNTTWSRTDILLQVPPIAGTSGADTLYGTSADNAFNAGLGNDTIRSGGGSDLHIYASGDGSDLIDEESGSNSEVDTLWFTDINAADITLTRAGAHMKVNITATGDQITIDEQYFSSSSNWGIEQIRFADGTVWNRDTIMQNSWWNGTSGNDNLSGWASYDNIDGGAGNDTINGNAGIDKIVGGSGDDILTGGAGNDTFIFKSGFGLDTITDFTAGAASDDVIRIEDGLFADFAAVQAASAQVGSNVVITLDASNTITLQNVTLANLHQDDFQLV